jgi:hypothetical protein
MEASFEIYLRIHTPEDLVKAAQTRAIAEGVDETDALEQYNDDNLNACLIMLLDPSTLPGCNILESTAEVQPLSVNNAKAL